MLLLFLLATDSWLQTNGQMGPAAQGVVVGDVQLMRKLVVFLNELSVLLNKHNNAIGSFWITKGMCDYQLM